MKNSDADRLDRWPRLARAWEKGRLAQSLLVIGSEAVSDDLGQALVRRWLCEANGGAECRCRSCATPLEQHPDLAVVSPEPRTIRREAVGRALEGTAMEPLWSPSSVIWFKEAEKLTPQAESHLLKTLEEPPAYLRLLLTTAFVDRLLATVRSRCQWFRVGGADVPSAADSGFSPDALFDRDVPLEEALEQAGHYLKRRYLADPDPAWLHLWDTVWRMHNQLEWNGNADIIREVLRESFRLAPR